MPERRFPPPWSVEEQEAYCDPDVLRIMTPFIWALISAVILGGAFYFDRVLR
jgi:hypothetical protein